MNPIGEFHRLHKLKDKSRCIEGAILPTQLSDAAQWFAAVVQAERPVDRPVLCGLVCKHADKMIEEIKHAVSLLLNLEAAR